eukprot:g830.t1
MQDVRRELRRSLSLQSEQIKRLSQSKADKQLRLQQEKEAREAENAPDHGVDDVGKEKNQRLRRGKSVSFAPGSPELKRFQSSGCLVDGQEGSAVQRKQAKTAKWAKMRSLSWRSGLAAAIPDDVDYPALADRFGSLPDGAATASSTIKTKKKKYKASNTAIEEMKTTPKKLGGQKASSSMCALM